MKKQLLSILFFCTIALASQAQCIIDNNVQGFSPDSLTGIPPATVTMPYNTDIQFHIPADTIVLGFTVSIDSAHIDSVNGYPGGFSYATNPANGSYTGNSNGCMRISGTPMSGDETGGPNSDGVYPLTINYTLYLTIPFVGPQVSPVTNDDYRLVVSTPVGLKAQLIKKNDAVVYPNPANNQAAIEFVSTGNQKYTLAIYNYTGQLVSSQNGNTNNGLNKIAINTTAMANGAYIYRLTTDRTVISQTFSVEH